MRAEGALTPGPSPTPWARGDRPGKPPGQRVNRGIRNAARANRKAPTTSEHLLWGALRGRRLDQRKFRRQHPIGVYVLDFYCEQERLAVEVDGAVHRATQEADRQRQATLEALGIRFVRLPAALVESNIEAAVAVIRDAFHSVIPPSLPLSRARERGPGGEG